MVYLSGRGCPFGCAFCTEPFMFQGQMAEPEAKVAADLEAFQSRLRAGYLWLCDPLFGASPRRLRRLLPILARSPLSFLYESRVDTLAPESVAEIREAGGDLVYLGLEAASDRSLLQIAKVSTHDAARAYRERALALVEACASSDVVPVLGVLNPVPGDRGEDLEQTLAFLAQLNELAELVARRSGSGIRPFFHAFPYRIDRGTAAARAADQHSERFGTTWSAGEEEIFCEREILDASRSVDRAAAAAFRSQVRKLNRGGPELMCRVLRSMPRPFLARRWPTPDAFDHRPGETHRDAGDATPVIALPEARGPDHG